MVWRLEQDGGFVEKLKSQCIKSVIKCCFLKGNEISSWAPLVGCWIKKEKKRRKEKIKESVLTDHCHNFVIFIFKNVSRLSKNHLHFDFIKCRLTSFYINKKNSWYFLNRDQVMQTIWVIMRWHTFYFGVRPYEAFSGASVVVIVCHQDQIEVPACGFKWPGHGFPAERAKFWGVCTGAIIYLKYKNSMI